MSQLCKISLVVCAVICVCFTHNTYGQCELETLFASDTAEYSKFGNSVAIDGDTMIIGAHRDSSTAYSVGAAYIFRRINSTWIEEAKLLASDGEQYDEFGKSVAISGNIALVGAYRNDGTLSDSGAAYVFRFVPDLNEWVEQTKLLASDGNLNDKFGISVAMSGDVLVVGSVLHYHIPGQSYTGAAYVFRTTDGGQTWEQEAELLAIDGAYHDFFGAAVDIDGDYVVIGADSNDDFGSNSGSAYIFKYIPVFHDKWLQVKKLLPMDGNGRDYFGDTVAISGGVCVIGATRVDGNEINSGAAYIFRRNDDTELWTEETKLLASDGGYYDHFGVVAIEGDVVAVGSPDHSLPINDAGAVYIYKYQENTEAWVEHGKLLASDNEQNYSFGSAVAISGTLGISGSPDHDGAASHAGAVYTFNTLAQEDSNNNGIPDACETGIGDLNFDGFVNSADLQILLGYWGACPGEPFECLGDINGDQFVNTSDLLILFGNWG